MGRLMPFPATVDAFVGVFPAIRFVFTVRQGSIGSDHSGRRSGLVFHAPGDNGFGIIALRNIGQVDSAGALKGHRVSDDPVARVGIVRYDFTFDRRRKRPEFIVILLEKGGAIEDGTAAPVLNKGIRGGGGKIPRPICTAAIGEPFTVVIGVHPNGQTEIAEVAVTPDRNRFAFGFRQGRQEHAGEDRDDGDDHQEFDQCKRGDFGSADI